MAILWSLEMISWSGAGLDDARISGSNPLALFGILDEIKAILASIFVRWPAGVHDLFYS